MVDAIGGRYVATTGTPGPTELASFANKLHASLGTDLPKGETPTHIESTGSMVELLGRIGPVLYPKCTIDTRKGKKILYAKANKAIYGTLEAAALPWGGLKTQLGAWGP